MNKYQKKITKIAKRLIDLLNITSWVEAKAYARMHLDNGGKVSDVK